MCMSKRSSLRKNGDIQGVIDSYVRELADLTASINKNSGLRPEKAYRCARKIAKIGVQLELIFDKINSVIKETKKPKTSSVSP